MLISAIVVVTGVKIDHSRSLSQVLAATGCDCRDVSGRALIGAPDPISTEEQIIQFFKPEEGVYDELGLITDDKLEAEYNRLGLIDCGLRSVAAVNEEDHDFLREYPHAIHWKNEGGDWCYAFFRQAPEGKRILSIAESDPGGYCKDFWFAGVKK